MDFHALAAGADDWFDELTVSILVPAVDQFGQVLGSIGALVVDPGEIERAEWVVRRPDDEQAGEAAVELLQAVARAGAFEGGDMFTGPAANLDAPSRELVRLSFRRGGTDQDHLLGASGGDFAEQSSNRRRAIT